MSMRLVVVGSTLAVVIGVGRADTTPPFAPPPAGAVDRTLPRPDDVDVLGTTGRQTLLKLSSWATRDSYYGVIDADTKCIVETYPTFARVEALVRHSDRSAAGQSRVTAALADRATQDEIRTYLALRSRFGSRKDAEAIYAGDFAWSADGSKIVATINGSVYRSRDGGQRYELLDTEMAYKPYVTADGRFAFFQRCGTAGGTHACSDAQKEVGIVALDSATKPRIVNIGRGTVEGLDPTRQRLLVVRDDEPRKVVAMHLDPDTATFHRAFEIPAPPLEPNTYFTISTSRNGRFGQFHHWISKRGDRALQQSVAVIDMTTGRIVHEQRQPFVGTDVDDEGRLAWGTVNSVRGFATTPKGRITAAGAGEPVGWLPGGQLVMFASPSSTGTLGDALCKVVQIKPI